MAPRLGQKELGLVNGTQNKKSSMGDADFRGSDVETSERACRSCDVRDPRSGHQVATVEDLDFERASVSKRCEEYAFERDEIKLAGRSGQRSTSMKS